MVKSLIKGLNILQQFNISQTGLNFQELVSKTGIPKATVSRFLRTLTSQGYLYFNPKSNKYILGPRLINLGFSALSNVDLRNTALPYLEELAEQCNQCVNLGILDNKYVILICTEHVKRWDILGINVHIGSRLNSYQSSIGKAILAFLDEKKFQFVLNNLLKDHRAMEHIGPKGKVLINALEEVRRKKYALNDEEVVKGLRSIAAPVFDIQGEVEGAVNIPVFSHMVSREELIERFVPLLLNTTNKISNARGFVGNKIAFAKRLTKK
jgi:IclR family pca regulon transcriptional regulator